MVVVNHRREGRWSGQKEPKNASPRLSFRCTVLSRLFPCPLSRPWHLSQGQAHSHLTCTESIGFGNQLATGHCPWPPRRLCRCCFLVTKHQVVPDSFATPWTEARQAPLSMGFPTGKSTGVGCHFPLQGIYPTEGLNPRLQHWQVDSLPLSHLGST